MNINTYNSVNFNGLWAPVKTVTKEVGHKNIDKAIYTMYDMVYHPWVGESKQAIEKAVNKYFHGLTYSVHDVNEGQMTADMYKVNFVRVGDAISKESAKKYLDLGYKKTPNDYVQNVDELYDSYGSVTGCNINDVQTYDKEKVKAFVKRHFNINA